MSCSGFQGGGAPQVVQDVFAAQRSYANSNYAQLQADIAAYLQALGELDRLMEPTPPKDWSYGDASGPRRVLRPDQQAGG